jgi:hypothetical protein
MKKFMVIFFAVSLVLVSIISASAANTIDFSLSDASCYNNRLVEIEVKAKSSIKLCSATFEFTYNKEMFEFRSVKSSDDNSKVQANELDSCVKVIYLNSNGKDLSEDDTVFTITLKAIDTGVGYLDFTVNDCVDSEINSVDIGECSSAKITVNSTSSNSNSNSSNNSSGAKSSSGSSDKSKSKIESSTDSSNLSTIDNLGTISLNELSDKTIKFLIIGVALGVSLVIIVAGAFYLGKKICQTKS